MQTKRESLGASVQRTWTRTMLWCFLAVIAFYLLAEHTAHLFGVLPYLLLAACPLMHLFMHGNRGGHGSGHNHDSADRDDH